MANPEWTDPGDWGCEGRTVGPEPADEAEHFVVCGTCGQAFDCRILQSVFHHAPSHHQPERRF